MILMFINLFIKIITSQIVSPSKETLLNVGASQSRNRIIYRQLIDNIDVSLYSNGTTIIGGEGEFRNYSSTTSPFYPHQQAMTNVKIDDRIRSIGRFSFYGCDKLKQITFGPNLQTIYRSAFANCFNLQNLVFENESTKCSTKLFSSEPLLLNEEHTNKEKLEYKFCREIFECINIPNSSSLNCSVHQTKTFLEHQTIYPKNNINNQNDKSQGTNRNIRGIYTGDCGDEVQYSIDTETFKTTISGRGPMTNYDRQNGQLNSPFYSRNQYISSLSISNGVTSIGSYSFYDCTQLTSVIIPDSVTSIGIYAFTLCSSLTSIIIPSSVTSIGDSAFGSCSKLANITLPNNSTVIGSSTFASCSSLTSITIPYNLSSTGEYCFAYCSGLTSITISSNKTSIGYCSFSGCSSLIEVNYLGQYEPHNTGRNVFQNCPLLFVNVVNSYMNETFCGFPVNRIIPDFITPSYLFTISRYFTESNAFSLNQFFTDSALFSNSIDFTNSLIFTESNPFAGTQIFSNSLEFSLSSLFSQSTLFSISDCFSQSQRFSLSNEFTNSHDFSLSGYFTNSYLFSTSNEFTISEFFTYSNEFTASEKHSRVFTKSELFSESVIFSMSDTFTESKGFTSSNPFTPDRYPPNSHPEPGEKKQSQIIIIASVLAVFLILIIFIILILRFKRRKKKEITDDWDFDDKYGFMKENQQKKCTMIPVLFTPKLNQRDLSYSVYDEEETYYEYEYEYEYESN